jgi:hypothetical protein
MSRTRSQIESSLANWLPISERPVQARNLPFTVLRKALSESSSVLSPDGIDEVRGQLTDPAVSDNKLVHFAESPSAKSIGAPRSDPSRITRTRTAPNRGRRLAAAL